jgi:hypothetical protein
MNTPITEKIISISKNWGECGEDSVTEQEAYEDMVLALKMTCRKFETEISQFEGYPGIAHDFELAKLEITKLRAINAELIEALKDAEFLMRKAGCYPGPMQDSFNRAAKDAKDILAKAK